ncbi:glycoside hydrolase family 73 protein [Cohnella nanjingensis]|uniref:Glucosaminidase domain-containing protein n=1 Tax=Cohnella nanjingensis TaxID=1387779 RepID=A0A7X0VHU0_9BACL|nr:glucosaminidase domain-containing protein [Cohnella nanjingensis]MBB6674497.1 glucosaminidase domain-containing protein [Cohnella nanjingensis]
MPDPNGFIMQIAPAVQADQLRTGVPASLTIAQAALESNWGTSGLTRQANNLFGMKGAGPAGSITMSTTEYVNGQYVQMPATFRAYRGWNESIADHSVLLQNRRYAGVLRTDGRKAAKAVAAAGYATDPKYADKLIKLMDDYHLYAYDQSRSPDPAGPTTPAPYQISEADAEKLVRFLSAGWWAAVTPAGRAEFNRLANEVRAAAGLPGQ